MTLYVRNELTRTLTANQIGSKRFELAAKGNVGYLKVLPLDVAKLDGFQRLWAAGSVTVSTKNDFSAVVTEIPDTELAGAIAPVTGVTDLAADATLPQVVAKVNALLAKLR